MLNIEMKFLPMVLLVSAAPAFSDTVINFGSGGLALLTNQYFGQGVVGSNFLITNNVGGALNAVKVPSPPNHIDRYNQSAGPGVISFMVGNTPATTGSLTVSFLGLIPAASNSNGGLDVTYLDEGTLEVYGLANNLIATKTIAAKNNQSCSGSPPVCVALEVPIEQVSFTNPGIHSLRFQHSGNDLLGFDDLKFQVPEATPEPALSGAVAVVLLALLAKRRRANKSGF